MKPVKVKMKPIGVWKPDTEDKLKETGIADLNTGLKMKPIIVKIKQISVANLNVEVKIKPTGVADLDAGVKIKTTE